MAGGKFSSLAAIGTFLGGVAAFITVFINLQKEEPKPGPSTDNRATMIQPGDNAAQVAVAPEAPPPPPPPPDRREQLLGTWTGSYGTENYTISYYGNGTYQLTTGYPLFGTFIQSSGIWTFNYPYLTIQTNYSSDIFTLPVGTIVNGEILDFSPHQIVLRTPLAPGITFVKQ